MIETFVLLMFLKTGYGGGALSAEFNSRESCEQAAEELSSKSWASITYVCVPK